MTNEELRDEMAMRAMVAVIGKHEPLTVYASDENIPQEIALGAWSYADAFMVERANRTPVNFTRIEGNPIADPKPEPFVPVRFKMKDQSPDDHGFWQIEHDGIWFYRDGRVRCGTAFTEDELYAGFIRVSPTTNEPLATPQVLPRAEAVAAAVKSEQVAGQVREHLDAKTTCGTCGGEVDMPPASPTPTPSGAKWTWTPYGEATFGLLLDGFRVIASEIREPDALRIIAAIARNGGVE